MNEKLLDTNQNVAEEKIGLSWLSLWKLLSVSSQRRNINVFSRLLKQS